MHPREICQHDAARSMAWRDAGSRLRTPPQWTAAPSPEASVAPREEARAEVPRLAHLSLFFEQLYEQPRPRGGACGELRDGQPCSAPAASVASHQCPPSHMGIVIAASYYRRSVEPAAAVLDMWSTIEQFYPSGDAEGAR
jgi:hypothetical protein